METTLQGLIDTPNLVLVLALAQVRFVLIFIGFLVSTRGLPAPLRLKAFKSYVAALAPLSKTRCRAKEQESGEQSCGRRATR
jgi:hypothetical protein